VGCSGLVSVSSNVWPEETAKYVDLCLSGETESLFPVWKRAVEALFSAPNPVPVKVLLHEKGMIEHSALRSPLTEKELKSIEQLKRADEEIVNWYQKINN
jgi:4-hydroxy-tetrahydrodipicolinate synthase